MCEPCYKAASLRIEKGEATWDELVKLGLAGPPGKRGRKSNWQKAADAVLSKKKRA